MKNYRITIKPFEGGWYINVYALKLNPVYERGGSQTEPARVEEEWFEIHWDAALFYWEARLIAWNLKRKVESGKLGRGEETIYERKG